MSFKNNLEMNFFFQVEYYRQQILSKIPSCEWKAGKNRQCKCSIGTQTKLLIFKRICDCCRNSLVDLNKIFIEYFFFIYRQTKQEKTKTNKIFLLVIDKIFEKNVFFLIFKQMIQARITCDRCVRI